MSSITYDNKDKIRYSYDNMGNISNVYDNDELAVRYVYDGLNRLVREDNKYFSKTVLYSYDNNGNILKKREFNFTLKEYIELEELDSTDSVYEYENDRLLKYNDKTCTYNTDGRITNFLGNNLTWNMFDYLEKIGSITFKYDSYGRRTKKNNTTFVYDSSNNLIQVGSMEFLYDITGLCGLTYNGNTYTYRKNALGDIIALVDTNGTIVVKYIYI